MQISCRCGRVLTNDLCLTKNTNESYFEGYEKDKHRKGFFSINNRIPAFNNKWSDDHPAQIVPERPKTMSVSVEDYLLSIPPMPSGYGCCDWSMGAKLHCSCGRLIGFMYLDCYEDKSINFIHKSVIRNYDLHKDF